MSTGIYTTYGKLGIQHDKVAEIDIHTLVSLWLITTVVTDGGITGCLSVALFRARTGIRHTDHLINQFIRGAVQTGVLAGIFSLSCLAATLSGTHASWPLMFVIPTGRIYTTTLLYSLLLRENQEENHSQEERNRVGTSSTRAMQLTSAIEIGESETSPSDILMNHCKPDKA
ncbi:hypothetical protein CONPUDRAFT_140492 [Coniophora puteana RWD-64-598 SS2]|uniref:DUF6534 domain-containing protein n=1 Tax=Coniophora puteana (strain RWD-64-598) TaxID=741705 RepID=R7SEQ9_CONPW|nr:uncharacterized protein CONPUDRAFT_140492 [Coniophora puteana RWD-64-598 SS2]EIW74355.1 hypothetical protein CONPUDRAFT_140492 [Coniophora puteana RWD-64-598 SS2]